MPEIPRITPHNKRVSLWGTVTKTQGQTERRSVHDHDITETSLTTEAGSRGTRGEQVRHGRRWSTRGEALKRPTRQSVPPELSVTSRSPASWRPHRTPASRHGMLHQINSSGTTVHQRWRENNIIIHPPHIQATRTRKCAKPVWLTDCTLQYSVHG